ncbi:MAG: A24 family peptidase [Cellvibrionaceae bacterium]|nr:A24 family peptidase [Cellvibrionaceae bacterium]
MQALASGEFVSYSAIALALGLGLLVGSFLNVVIYRMPLVLFHTWKKECVDFLAVEQELEDAPPGIVFPASHCPQCKVKIKPWHNIPVLSFLLLRGKCAHCQHPISIRYPLVELVTGLLTGFVVIYFALTPQAALAALLTWCLVVLTMIDVDHKLLPDTITLPLLWLGLGANSFNLFVDLESAVYGAIFGYLSLWSFYWLFKLATGKDGMGFGDFKLFAALGAWMGWKMLLPIIILSSMVGAIVGISGILIYGRDKNIPMPFGPYLAAAGWIALFWGEAMVNYYLNYSVAG